MQPRSHPPLGAQAAADLRRLPQFANVSIHLSIVSVVCNGLHRHAGAARALDCDQCGFAGECAQQVDGTITYMAELGSRVSRS